MATEQQIKNFIQKIGPCAVTAYKTLGKVLPSVCIGMACVESAYGTAESAKFNSYMGQKVGSGKTATKYWGGKFFKSITKEEYTVGTHTIITDAFRAYDSLQQCVLNYYELLNSSLYSPVKAGETYSRQMQQIKACGYMTSSTEVNSVIKIIEKYCLYEWDKETLIGSGQTDTVDGKPKTGNPYSEPEKAVRRGSKGNSVRWVQYQLNLYGYRLLVDGVYKDKTYNAVVAFQKQAFPDDSKEWDGIVGAKTREALKKR